MTQLHRSDTNKMIGGVCGGMAESLGVDPIYIRLLFVLFSFYVGNGLLVYLILWIVVPVMPMPEEEEKPQLYRVRANQMIGGVCTGLGRNLSTDPTIIRLVFVGLTLMGGGGILIYLLLWILMPPEPYK